MKHYFLTKYLSPRGPHNVSVMVLRGYAKTLAAQTEPLGGVYAAGLGPEEKRAAGSQRRSRETPW